MSFDGQITGEKRVPRNITVNPTMAKTLDRLAKERGQLPSRYDTELFEAATTARVKPEVVFDAELVAAVNGSVPPATADDGKAALQAMLRTLQKNYNDQAAELRTVRAELNAAKKGADNSSEVLELRRKAIAFDATLAQARKETAKALKDLEDYKAKAVDEIRSLKGKAVGFEQQLRKAKELPAPSDETVKLRATIAELGGRVAMIDKVRQERDEQKARVKELTDSISGMVQKLDSANANLRLVNLDRDALKKTIATYEAEIAGLNARIVEHQEARLDHAREIQKTKDAIDALLASKAAPKAPEAAPEPPQATYDAHDEFRKLWKAINKAESRIFLLETAAKKSQAHAREKAVAQ